MEARLRESQVAAPPRLFADEARPRARRAQA
jgi:hypothetical protein